MHSPNENRVRAQHKYAFREDAFDILTAESKYWLGFLFADGSIVVKRTDCSPHLQLQISLKDVEHLRKFKDFMGAPHKIQELPPRGEKGGEGIAHFRVSSWKLVSRLTQLGMTSKPKRFANDELLSSRDFWRGVVDGDGHIGFTDNRPVFQLAGWPPLLYQFQGFSGNITKAKMKPIGGGAFRIATTCKPAFEIIKLLYSDTSLSLARKLAIAQSMIGAT